MREEKGFRGAPKGSQWEHLQNEKRQHFVYGDVRLMAMINQL
jgi:hypothetical protein